MVPSGDSACSAHMRIWHLIFNNSLAGCIGTSLCLITRLYCWKTEFRVQLETSPQKIRRVIEIYLKSISGFNTVKFTNPLTCTIWHNIHTTHMHKHTKIHIHMCTSVTPHTYMDTHTHAQTYTSHTCICIHTHTNKIHLCGIPHICNTTTHIKNTMILNFFLKFLYFRRKKEVILNFKELSLRG